MKAETMSAVRFRKRYARSLASVDYDKPRTIFLEPSPEWLAHERVGSSAATGILALSHETQHHAVVKVKSMAASDALDTERVYNFIRGRKP